MSTFVCEECHSIDNTALTRFWSRSETTNGRALCSACDKGGPHGGKWHGYFPRHHYKPGAHQVGWVDGEWQDRDAA